MLVSHRTRLPKNRLQFKKPFRILTTGVLAIQPHGMNALRATFLAIVAATMFVSVGAAAQTQQQPNRPTPRSAGGASVRSPGMMVDRLPPQYQSPDLDAIIADIAARNLDQRDRFETTAQFEERRRQGLATPTADGLPVEAERTFVLFPRNDRTTLPLNYDPDRSLASWRGRERGGFLSAFSSINCWDNDAGFTTPSVRPNYGIWACVVVNKREEFVFESAVTRMNLPFTIRVRYHDFTGVLLCMEGQYGIGPAGTCAPFRIDLSINLEPHRARELLQGDQDRRLRVAVVGRPVQPYVVADRRSGTATLTSPFSHQISWRALNLQTAGLLFFDYETGQILLRLPPVAEPSRPQSGPPRASSR